MNPTVDNDLQKAIDDITKSTNSDPVFADPVAAPVPITSGTNPAPLNPAAVSAPQIPTPMPEPILPEPPIPAAPAPNLAAPGVNTPSLDGMPMPPLAEPAPLAGPTTPVSPAPAPEPAAEPVTIAEPLSEPAITETSLTEIDTTPLTAALPTDVQEVKKAALRDLAPIMDGINLPPAQKFHLYRNMIDDLKDNTVISSAYQAAKDISDEHERGEALLYLIESIDKM